MGLFTSRERLLKPDKARFVFLFIGAAAFAATEFGKHICRPYFRGNSIYDFGLTDSIGNWGGIIVQIFLGLAIFSSGKRQSYRLAAFFSIGCI